MKLNRAEVLDLGNVVNEEMMEILHYFARNTIDRIFHHIERLDIKDTGALKKSIRATVSNMSSGNIALVNFFYINYGVFVEQAVGKYYGVDSDLGHKRGVKSVNIGAPEITSYDYGAMKGQIKGIPERNPKVKSRGGERGAFHRPRPFLMSEIRYQLRRTQWRLLEQLGYTASAHLIKDIKDVFELKIEN
jgi:hypothetical protein